VLTVRAVHERRRDERGIVETSSSLSSLPVADDCPQLAERQLRDVVGGSDRALLGRFECC
jgi:hypothetical protein